MARLPNDLLHGTLDVLVLKTLSWGPTHGYGICRLIEQRTQGVLQVEDAALYKALHRLQRAGAIESEWGVSDNNRRARFYRLTSLGRRELRAEMATWRRYAAAIVAVLGTG
jgi:PadR family transcriptional regulator PadR